MLTANKNVLRMNSKLKAALTLVALTTSSVAQISLLSSFKGKLQAWNNLSDKHFATLKLGFVFQFWVSFVRTLRTRPPRMYANLLRRGVERSRKTELQSMPLKTNHLAIYGKIYTRCADSRLLRTECEKVNCQ